MSIRSRLTSRMGFTIAALLLLTVSLVGCADLFDGLKPEITDNQETLDAKQKVASLTAELAKLKADTEAHINRLKQELEAEKNRAAMLLEMKKNELWSKIFPARELYFIAAGIIVIAVILSMWFPKALPTGVLGAALLAGYASLQSLEPWILAAVFGGVALLAGGWYLMLARREKAIGIMATAIESDQDTKTVIKEDGKVAKFVEKFIRPHLKKLAA